MHPTFLVHNDAMTVYIRGSKRFAKDHFNFSSYSCCLKDEHNISIVGGNWK